MTQPSCRRLALAFPLLLPAAALLGSCAPSDPATRSAPLYVSALEPLLYENGLLAERVLVAAAEVHDDRADPGSLQAAWSTEIVPLARHLADQAAVSAPPAEWAVQHEQLVAVWTTRADAYAGIGDALETGSRELWKSSRKQADDAKLKEEEWFRTTNELLAPAGLALDQFP